MHTALKAGDPLTIRGPYGNHFPVECEASLKGQNLLFIAGGIGLAPVRSVIRYVFDNRENYGDIDILYGSRSMGDLVYREEIETSWLDIKDTKVHLTIDRSEEGWGGNVGFVPAFLEEIAPANDKKVVVCGPPIMIKFVMQSLLKMGFKKEQVFTTLELRMKCGIGKCGRCNLGPKYVCIDGPVFRTDELDGLPDEF